MQTQKFCGQLHDHQERFENLFENFTELFQPDFTHRQKGKDDVYTHFSKLERVFTNLPPAKLFDMHTTCATAGSVRAPQFILSDHLCVNFAIQPKARDDRSFPSIPRWVAEHALWPVVTQDLCDMSPGYRNPFEELAAMKRIFHRASEDIKKIAAHHNAQRTDEKLWWAMRALRCLRSGSLGVELEYCFEAYPDLLKHLCSDGNFFRLEGLVAELAIRTAEEKTKEIDDTKDLPEYFKKLSLIHI